MHHTAFVSDAAVDSTVLCIQNTRMAYLVQLESTPDLVDRVYRSLLDAISEGSLAPGQRITQEEIAARLFIAPHTAKLHTLHIYQKLQVNARQDAVAKAQGLGLLTRHGVLPS